MIYRILLITLIIVNSLYSQKKNRLITFINDNDLYTSISRDRYYTNGMFLSYSFLSDSRCKNVLKKKLSFTLGHKMYTPYKATVANIKEHDRPFAGYLFGSFGYTNYYINEIFSINSEIGILGPHAYGKELMEVVHNLYNFIEADGWKYQIKNDLALTLNLNYTKKILFNTKTDINWINNIKLGTIFNEITTGLYSRIGIKPLKKLYNSIAFKANLKKKLKTKPDPEFFFFIKPTLSYVLFDATIQGGITNKSPITYSIYPVKFETELGLHFTLNNFNLGYSITYHTKKIKSEKVPTWNNFGSIQIGYLIN